MKHETTGTGKGSTRRHTSDLDKYSSGWDRIFGKKEEKDREATKENNDK